MKKLFKSFLAAGILALSACTAEDPQQLAQASPETAPEAVSELAYQSGTLYVKVSSDITTATKASGYDELAASLGVASIERMFPDAGKWEARHKKYGLDKWYIVTYDPDVPRTKAEKDFSSLGGIEEVSTPLQVELHSTDYFNDPYYYQQWAYYNDAQYSRFKKGMDINVVPVWEEFTTGSKDVIVAVVDGGADYTHPDLEGVIIPGGDDGSWNFVDKSPELDPHHHGTHVSGTIGAINNNGQGVSGVAGGSDGTGGVKILSCQVFKEDNTSGGFAQAIIWACDHGATIVNNSWGYTAENEEQARRQTLEPSLKNAIDYFVECAGLDENGNQVGPMKGGVVFFSAGNGDSKYNKPLPYAMPAAYENVLAVAAMGPDGKPSSYTNYGEWVDIMAPGGESSIPNGGIISTYPVKLSPNNPYAYLEGTSMACPHVTGVAALILSYYGGPGFTNEELKARLLLGARYNVASVDLQKYGPVLDAYGAMTLDLDNPPKISFANSDYEKDGVVLKSHEKRDIVLNVEGNQAKRFLITCDPGSDAASFEVNDDGNVVFTIDALKVKPGTYKAVLKAGFTSEKYSEFKFDYKINENHAPVVSAPVSYVIIEKQGGRKVLDMGTYFTDEDGESLSYSAELTNTALATLKPTGNQLEIVGNAFGETTVTVTGTDARGANASQSFKLLVYNPNNDPAVGPNPVENVLRLSKGAKHDMDVTIKSSTGVTVYSGTVSGDYYNPAEIDLSSLAPGKYGLKLYIGGNTYDSMIIKK